MSTPLYIVRVLHGYLLDTVTGETTPRRCDAYAFTDKDRAERVGKSLGGYYEVVPA